MADVFQLPEAPIRVDARGVWLHADEPINENVAALFMRHVTATDEGTYRIEWNNQKHAIEVEDTPFWVRSIDAVEKDGKVEKISLQISDGKAEELDPTTLMQSGENVLYCRIRRGSHMVPCRFAQESYHKLALKVESEGKAFVLPLAGQRHAIGSYDGRPQKVH